MGKAEPSHKITVADVRVGAGGRARPGTMAQCTCGWKSLVFDDMTIVAALTGRRHLQMVWQWRRLQLERSNWAIALHAKVTASARHQVDLTQRLLGESRNRLNLWIVAAARSAEADLRRLERHSPFHDGRHVWCNYESAVWPCDDFIDVANAQGVDVPEL